MSTILKDFLLQHEDRPYFYRVKIWNDHVEIIKVWKNLEPIDGVIAIVGIRNDEYSELTAMIDLYLPKNE